MEKIVVTSKDVNDIIMLPAGSAPDLLAHRAALSVRWRLATLALVPALPLLCLTALAVRFALGAASPTRRHAWMSWFNSLLIASGLLTTFLFSMAYFQASRPMHFASSLTALEYAAGFPKLPEAEAMPAQRVAERTTRLVFALSPDTGNLRLPESYLETAAVGAGLLIHANEAGFLLATNRHVVDGGGWLHSGGRTETILVFSKSGDYARARVVGRHKDFDLALVWMKRGAGTSTFVQPILPFREIAAGQNVFVIGHPERLFFSLSTGIVMRTDGDRVVQISAPVSPGNSGGPVYDEYGRLLGIVSFKVDRRFNPNAENLNFAVRADALLDGHSWEFESGGEELMAGWRKAYEAVFGHTAARLDAARGRDRQRIQRTF